MHLAHFSTPVDFEVILYILEHAWDGIDGVFGAELAARIGILLGNVRGFQSSRF